MKNTTIIEKHELVDLWPGTKNAYKCKVLQSDNTKRDVEIPKAECELLMYFLSIQHKLTQTEVTKLKELIENYGDERYQKAGDDHAMDDAGADL